jgi:hypothetical protein
MLTIRKKSNKNFWHYDSNFTNAYSASDLTIIFDGDIVKLRSENGRIVFNKDGYLFSDITIYDDSSSGGAEVFASAILLAERLVALGYNGYYEGGDAVAGVSSAFGRTGAVVAVDEDYDINEIGRVSVTTPTNGQILAYNIATGKFENTNNTSGGTVTSVNGDAGPTVLLDTSNIPEVTDKKYTTDAQQTVLNNTSNTNTGDQDLSGLESASNKQDSLTTDGTGAKFPTVDATNAGLLLKAVKTQTDFISGLIPLPVDSSYKLILKAPYAGTITEITTQSVSGTCTATFKINTTALGGTANSVSSTEQSQAHASANAFVAGDDIVLTVSANATCVDMSFTIKFTKTLS